MPGEQWEAGITDALQRADIVLLFYTTAARVETPDWTGEETTLSVRPAHSQSCAPVARS